jgi:hypothetical protein
MERPGRTHGIFEAAALAWTYFYTDDGRALQNRDLSMVQSRIQPGPGAGSSPGPGIRPANANGQARDDRGERPDTLAYLPFDLICGQFEGAGGGR